MSRIPIALVVTACVTAACGKGLIDSQNLTGQGVVTSSGGIVEAGAAIVSIPANAVSASETITVGPGAMSVALPSGLALIGSAVSVGPANVVLASPATIWLPGPTQSGNYMVLGLLAPDTSFWKAIPDAEITGGNATFQTSRLGTFVVVQTTSCSVGNGGCSANATCREPGSIIDCQCGSGFEGDGVTCIDSATADQEFCDALSADPCGSAQRTDSWGNVHDANCGFCASADDICGLFAPNVCSPSDTAFCETANANCGTVTSVDPSGKLRIVECGFCTSPDTCGANQCGCVPQPMSAASVCAAAGAQCGQLATTDSCGAPASPVDCGGCAASQACENNQCVCIPDADAQLCAANGAQCGSLTVTDNCGASRQISCGGCASGATCGTSRANQCPCTPESAAQLCWVNGAQCGWLTAQDNCGVTQTVDCGVSCPGGQRCGTAGPNLCGCQSESVSDLCAANGATCGAITATDNCGTSRTVQCGSCPRGSTCESTNVCSCIEEPDQVLCASAGAQCGTLTTTDNCGNARQVGCGTCADGATCSATNQCPCTPESDAAFCEVSGAQCGSLTGQDNCGAIRTVDCGSCADGGECGVSQPHVCGCIAESDATLCQQAGAQCGSLQNVYDNCGVLHPAVDCGDGGVTCSANQFACIPESDATLCQQAGAWCGSVTAVDNCGTQRTVPCGTCADGGTCGAVSPNTCDCAPESDATLCANAGAECGALTATDNCGNTRTVDCGGCPAQQTCQPGANTCECNSESDAQLCETYGAQCGSLSGVDNCGKSRTVASCGTCASGVACGIPSANSCGGCMAESDAQLCTSVGATCGTITALDNCGTQRTADCGACAPGTTCGAATPSICGCVPESPAQLCVSLGVQCGILNATDNCGNPVSGLNCGMCATGSECGTIEKNQCSCVPESVAQLCSAQGQSCGSVTATDNCGTQRTVDCGTCTDAG